MKIGDRVRLLRGREEGIITKIDQDLVEIEIEDGFNIPVLKNEVVVISSVETDFFSDRIQPAVPPVQKIEKNTQVGVFLAFVEINDKVLSVHLINNTEYELPYIIGEDGVPSRGIQAGKLNPYTSEKITERIVQEFDQWPALVVQLLYFRKSNFEPKEPLIKSLKFKANSFFRSKKTAPVISKAAFLFQIDAEIKSFNPELLQEHMMGKPQQENIEKPQAFQRPAKEVDLHIEKLAQNYSSMSSGEILQIQIAAFEKNLDQAIASGMDEIIFIHGAGNGVLKNTIHKALSKNPGIKFFKDARKEKFGYGATLVGLV